MAEKRQGELTPRSATLALWCLMMGLPVDAPPYRVRLEARRHPTLAADCKRLAGRLVRESGPAIVDTFPYRPDSPTGRRKLAATPSRIT
jgi:hypothetical protein